VHVEEEALERGARFVEERPRRGRERGVRVGIARLDAEPLERAPREREVVAVLVRGERAPSGAAGASTRSASASLPRLKSTTDGWRPNA
jgi:hypothetical protein